MHFQLSRWTSPLSPLLIVTDAEGALRALEFPDLEPRLHRLLHSHYGTYTLQKSPAPKPIVTALTAYFNGNLNALTEVPTATAGTDFQRQVWAALRTIPAGTTTSYGQLAQSLHRPNASRAVGAANATNPIPIVVPCHRVIGANGNLTGFASGLPRKTWLLNHERKHAATRVPANAELAESFF